MPVLTFLSPSPAPPPFRLSLNFSFLCLFAGTMMATILLLPITAIVIAPPPTLDPENNKPSLVDLFDTSEDEAPFEGFCDEPDLDQIYELTDAMVPAYETIAAAWLDYWYDPFVVHYRTIQLQGRPVPPNNHRLRVRFHWRMGYYDGFNQNRPRSFVDPERERTRLDIYLSRVVEPNFKAVAETEAAIEFARQRREDPNTPAYDAAYNAGYELGTANQALPPDEDNEDPADVLAEEIADLNEDAEAIPDDPFEAARLFAGVDGAPVVCDADAAGPEANEAEIQQ